MNSSVRLARSTHTLAIAGSALLGLSALPASAQVAHSRPLVPRAAAALTTKTLPFDQSPCLYNLAFDTDLDSSAGYGGGQWQQYRNWLGVANVGAEGFPGWANGDWWDACGTTGWNGPWGTMQQRYGSALPTVVLGTAQMPIGYLQNDGNPLDFENAQWITEASGDTNNANYNWIMSNFSYYAWQVDNGGLGGALPFQKVVVRMGYEFDGGWDPYGSLNAMSNMPNNYVQAWRNIVHTMRAADPKGIIKFCWNPTDVAVGLINTTDFYPGDDVVDYVGIDEYDVSANGEYNGNSVQPSAAQQQMAWTNTELPRMNRFADFARAHGKPMVIGEWGLGQLGNTQNTAGGDNPTYVQNMFNWMSDPNNHVAVECYFDAPASDGNHTLSGIFGPTPYPNAANEFRLLFGSNRTATAPPAPTVLTAFGNAVGNSGNVTLNWNASVGIPAATYRLYRGTTPGGEGAVALKTGLTANSFVNTGLKNGTTYYYTVKAISSAGTSLASNEASAVAGVPANYVVNGGFETGDTSGWSLWTGPYTSARASYVQADANAHSGSYDYAQWSPYYYALTLYQTINNVTPGPHVVSAWVESSGGQYASAMQVTIQGADGKPHETDVPIPAGPWTQISLPITVIAGPVSVAFYSNANGNLWTIVDDVVVK